MPEQYNLTVSEAELEELNGFINLLDCSEPLKNKVHYLLGYVRLLGKAGRTKAMYDRLVSVYTQNE